MPGQLPFALNQIAVPSLGCRAFLDLASSLGCVGVEFRNDLADKNLTSAPVFDGEAPAVIGMYAHEKGLRILGLSEVYAFNAWSDAISARVQLLIDQAKEAGAETISLIPRNDGPSQTLEERGEALRDALRRILPLLEAVDLVALIEPLGFDTSSLRRKADAVAAIKAVGGEGRFLLVHDTFHHHLAGETEFFPEFTGIVHISGVIDPALRPDQMQDAHRILVDARDRLGSVEQVRTLLDKGYKGAFSFEPFSPEVHALSTPGDAIRDSIDFISAAAVR